MKIFGSSISVQRQAPLPKGATEYALSSGWWPDEGAGRPAATERQNAKEKNLSLGPYLSKWPRIIACKNVNRYEAQIELGGQTAVRMKGHRLRVGTGFFCASRYPPGLVSTRGFEPATVPLNQRASPLPAHREVQACWGFRCVLSAGRFTLTMHAARRNKPLEHFQQKLLGARPLALDRGPQSGGRSSRALDKTALFLHRFCTVLRLFLYRAVSATYGHLWTPADTANFTSLSSYCGSRHPVYLMND